MEGTLEEMKGFRCDFNIKFDECLTQLASMYKMFKDSQNAKFQEESEAESSNVQQSSHKTDEFKLSRQLKDSNRYDSLKIPKLVFPTFDGVEPHEWIRKCEHYFLLHAISDDLKIRLGELHLRGKAELWLIRWKLNNPSMSISWESLKDEVCNRFDVGGLLIDEFGQQSSLKLEGAGATHNVFDKMPSLPSMKQNEGNDNTEDSVFPVVFLSQVKGSEVDIKEDESTNSSLKTELEEAFGDELKENLSSKLNHLGVNEESLAPLKIGDQYFGSEADFTTNMEICDQITLENETFHLFHEMLVSDAGKNMPFLAFIQTINLIKCKCKNRAPLSDNDVAFYFDPGGCTLSKMNVGTSEFCGEQGGLSLASGLAPNLADALVETISHEPCIMEAYGYGDVIEYSRTKKEFVGEGSTQNALMAWSPIVRDCEGQKIDHVIFRNVLDSFMVVPSKNVYEQSIRTACRLVWPKDRFLVQVLDDSDEDVAQLFLRNEVSSWEEKDVNIVYRHRNLKSATSQSYVIDYEFVAIIDADFQPNVGLRLVQAHWSFVNEDENSLTRLQNIKLCVHFEVILVSFPFQISVLSSKNRRHWLYLFIDAALDEKCWKIYLQKSDHCVSLNHLKWIHRALDFDVVRLFWMMLCNGSRVEEMSGLFASLCYDPLKVIMDSSDLMQSVVPLSFSLELNHLRDGYRKRDTTLDDLSCGHLEFFIPFNTNNDCLISSPYNSKKEPLEALYLLMKQHDGIHHETMHTLGETESYEPLFIFGRLDVIEDVLKAGCNTLGLKVSYLIWVVKTLVMFWQINQKCQSGHPFKNLDSVCTYCLVECSKDPVKDINLLYFDEAWSLVRIDNYEMPRSLRDFPKATSFRFDNIMVKVPYKQMIKAFYLFSWKHHLVLGKEIVFVVAINVENFVWDPGQSVISICILEGKDVFERMGKRIIPMDITWVIMEVIKDVQNNCIIMGWCEMAGYLNTNDGYMLRAEQYSEGLGYGALLIFLLKQQKGQNAVKGWNQKWMGLHGCSDKLRIIVKAIVTGISTSDVKLEIFVWDPGLYKPQFFFPSLRTRMS